MGFFFRKSKKKTTVKVKYCTAIVPAAGSGTRMGEDKLLLPLDGVPVIVHTLRALEGCPSIDEIFLVTRLDLVEPFGQISAYYALTKVNKILVGGETRTHSVMAGLQHVTKETPFVAIHDGARPLVTKNLVEEAILRAKESGAAAPAVPMKDTIKRGAKGWVEETVDRSTLYAIQTPQVFDVAIIQGALSKAVEDGAELTDDCSAVERLGMAVALSAGSYENIKVTTPEDMAIAEGLLRWRASK